MEELLKLYAPMAGLAALAFFVGALSTRQKQDRTDIDKLCAERDGDGGESRKVSDRLLIMETLFKLEMDNVKAAAAATQVEMRGLSRQVSSLMTGSRRGVVPPGGTIADAQGD